MTADISRHLPPTAEAVIVGGGVIGASCAYWLSRAGVDVVVVERRPELGTLTTPASLGSLRTQFGSASLVELAKESRSFLANADRHLGLSGDDLGFCPAGYLYATDDDRYLLKLKDALELYVGLGVSSSELIVGSALQRRFPVVGDGAVGAIFHAEGGWLDPTRITAGYAGAADAARFVVETEVSSIVVDGGRVAGVSTSRGDVAAPVVVDCAGPYAQSLVGPLGIDLPITLTPRFRAFLPDPAGDRAGDPFIVNVGNGSYWRPTAGGVWLSHANVDGTNVEPAESFAVPEQFLRSTIEQIAPVSPFFEGYLDRLADPDITIVSGTPMYTADDGPIIGSVASVPGLYLNCGHWAGVMLSPGSGRLLADVVTGRLADAENPFRPGRFGDGLVDRPSTNKFGGWG